MSALFKQPEWSIEEVVLLALASEDVTAMKVSLDDAAVALSKRLRYGAELTCVSIGQRYRNTEEVRNKLKLIASLNKMVGTLEDEYFSGSTIGQIALLAKKDRISFLGLANKALDYYPVIDEIPNTAISDENSCSEESTSSQNSCSQSLEEPALKIPEQTVTLRKRNPNIFDIQHPSRQNITGVNLAPSPDVAHNNEISTENNEINRPEDSEKSFLNNKTFEVEPKTGYQKYLALIKQVLAQYFKRGFRLNSPIDIKRFRAYYKTIHKRSIPFSDNILEEYILFAGFEYDGKLYLAEQVISTPLAEEIRDYIRSVFIQERGYIFYNSLYAHFEDLLLDTQIADVDMLKCWLQVVFSKDFAFTNDYIARSRYVTVSIKDEVETFVKDSQTVVTLDQLKTALNFLPLEKVQHEWNTIDELIVNGRNEKFHIKTFEISSSEREKIALLISTYLKDNPFITGVALIDEVQVNLPEIFANNAELSSLGLRNAIAYHLKDRFAFRNNIISDKNDALDGVNAMIAFCRSRGFFTVEEAEGMAKVIGSNLNIYLEHISKVALRVNDTEFIPKQELTFDSEKIDKALDIYVDGDYIPIESMQHFEAFPSCGEYPWNLRLLESYLLTANSRYSYYHPTFLAKDTISGAIVKKSSSLKSYEDVLVQALGEANIPLDESSANDYLYENGFIARRQKNGPVKGLLMKAKECRNRLKQKKS